MVKLHQTSIIVIGLQTDTKILKQQMSMVKLHQTSIIVIGLQTDTKILKQNLLTGLNCIKPAP